jgi:hypothetical protein
VSQSDSLGDLALHVRGLPCQNRPCPYRNWILGLKPQLTALIARGRFVEDARSPSLLRTFVAWVRMYVTDHIYAVDVRVTQIEEAKGRKKERGSTSRHDRAHLCPQAQLCQDAINQTIYRMGGLSASYVEGLEERLARMH